MPEVEGAVRQVERAHRRVKGVSSRGVPYDATHPHHAAWVHNALTDSFLTANQVYSDHPLTVVEADRFVEEQTRIGELLGAEPLPVTAGELSEWLSRHPDVAGSPEMVDVVDFLSDPPLSPGIKAGYLVLFQAAVTTLPPRLQDVLELRPRPGAEALGRAAVGSLRWALGYSPSWALASRRVGAEIAPGLFRRIPDGVLDRAS